MKNGNGNLQIRALIFAQKIKVHKCFIENLQKLTKDEIVTKEMQELWLSIWRLEFVAKVHSNKENSKSIVLAKIEFKALTFDGS